jgi:hypothetical protein
MTEVFKGLNETPAHRREAVFYAGRNDTVYFAM